MGEIHQWKIKELVDPPIRMISCYCGGTQTITVTLRTIECCAAVAEFRNAEVAPNVVCTVF